MYLEGVTSAIESELDVPAAQEIVAPSGDYLKDRIHWVKGILIASLFSLPIWIVVLSLFL